MKRLFYFLGCILFCFSCNKNQKTVDDLEGEWQIKKWQRNGNDVPFAKGTYYFDVCENKKNDCAGQRSIDVVESYIDLNGDSYSEIVTANHSIKYNVSELGKEMFLSLLIDSTSEIFTYDCDILLDENTFDLSFINQVGDVESFLLER